MSITAIGPALAIDGPLPVKPPYGLLSIPGVLEEYPGEGEAAPGEVEAGGRAFRDQGETRWMNGVNVWGYPSGAPLLWEPCSTGTNRLKDDDVDMPQPRFDAFGVYVPIVCSSISVGEWQVFADRARVVLEATASYAVEKALASGVQFSSNPFLGDSNVSNLAGGAAVKPESALALLEDEIGRTGRGGILHMPSGVAAYLGHNLLHIEDPDGRMSSGDEYIATINGTPVAAGGGYVDAASQGFNGSAATADNQWMFASGPVKAFLSDIKLNADNEMQTMEVLTNDVIVRAEMYALVEWDTALQSAVKVDLTP